MPTASHPGFHAVLRRRAYAGPTRCALTVLKDGEKEGVTTLFAQGTWRVAGSAP